MRRKFTAWSCEVATQAEGLTKSSVKEGAVSLRADGKSCLRDNGGTAQFSSAQKVTQVYKNKSGSKALLPGPNGQGEYV